MMTVIHAAIITILFCAIVFMVPALVVMIAPLIMIGCVFFVIWFILKVIAADQADRNHTRDDDD